MHLVSEDEAVPSEDSALYGIPDDELTVAILGEIKFIGIARLACPPAVEAEGFLTEAPYFLQISLPPLFGLRRSLSGVSSARICSLSCGGMSVEVYMLAVVLVVVFS